MSPVHKKRKSPRDSIARQTMCYCASVEFFFLKIFSVTRTDAKYHDVCERRLRRIRRNRAPSPYVDSEAYNITRVRRCERNNRIQFSQRKKYKC